MPDVTSVLTLNVASWQAHMDLCAWRIGRGAQARLLVVAESDVVAAS